jgi:hypothetical protein
MKRILRLTENDLIRLVKKVVNEQMSQTSPTQQRTTGIPQKTTGIPQQRTTSVTNPGAGQRTTGIPQQRTTNVTNSGSGAGHRTTGIPQQRTNTSPTKGSKSEWMNKYPCVTNNSNLLYDGMKGTYVDQKNQITYAISGQKFDRSGRASTFACSRNQIVGSVGGSTQPTPQTSPTSTPQKTTGITKSVQPTSPTKPMR